MKKRARITPALSDGKEENMKNAKKRIALLAAAMMIFTAVPALAGSGDVFAAEKSPRLAKVKLINYAAGKKSVKNTWNRVKGAQGYEIHRAARAKGPYKNVKTIKNGKTVAWTDKGLKEQQNYYYKVRAYRTVDDEKEYGKFSAAQNAAPTNYPNWSYSISKKTKRTRTIKLTITNKSKARMTFTKDGMYFKNRSAAKKWDAMTPEEQATASEKTLKAKGIYFIKAGKKRAVKPGKSITLTYKAASAVKYQRGGFVESSFRYNKKNYGVRHSSKYGESYWVYQ